MTDLLRRAIAEIEKLSEEQQNAIAARLLAELEDEQASSNRFEATTDRHWDLSPGVVQQEIADRVEQSDTWVKFAGMFKDDPLFEEFIEDMAAYRRELDAEVAAHESASEENQSA